jgi:hypothetical protein
MITPDNVKLKDWISIGNVDAVVCRINIGNTTKIEVVYLDIRERAIVEEVYFEEDRWHFVNDGPNGGYADNYPWFSEYVSFLRRGRWR